MPASFNETGRRLEDPSIELMQLMRKLQTSKVDPDKLVEIPAHLFDEGIAMIRRQPGINGIPYQDERFAPRMHALFCGHWVAPEPGLPSAA